MKRTIRSYIKPRPHRPRNNTYLLGAPLMVIGALAIVYEDAILGALLRQPENLAGPESVNLAAPSVPLNSVWLIAVAVGLSFIILFIGTIMAGRFIRNSPAILYLRAALLSGLAYVMTILTFLTFLVLFYFLNSGSMPPLIQVAGNSFLGMFLLLNMIHWIDKRLHSSR